MIPLESKDMYSNHKFTLYYNLTIFSEKGISLNIIYPIQAVYLLALLLLTCLKSCHELLCAYPFLSPWAYRFRVWNDFYLFGLFGFHHPRELVRLFDWDDGFYFSLKCKYLTQSMPVDIFINDITYITINFMDIDKDERCKYLNSLLVLMHQR